jgi:hypothetical protein
VQQTVECIQSSPVHASHYSTNSTKKKYLNPDLNVNKMYHPYLEKYDPEVFWAMKTKNSIKPSVNYEFYLHVFNTEFNYSFWYPRSNNCEKFNSLTLKLEKETDDDANKLCELEKIYISVTHNSSTTTSDVYEMAWHDKSTEGLFWLPAESSSSSTNNTWALLLVTGVDL